MITLDGVTKAYAGRVVLDTGKLTFDRGKKYVLIGPNGSGKSTLLRILAGAISPDTGTVTFAEDLRGKIGYMPQHPYAYGFSVLKNVTIALKGQENAGALAYRALERVNMLEFIDAKGNRLSGGETQRMALARMIALPRALLLLDEPTSATDISGNDCVETALLDYCREYHCSLIFSTHSLAQAQRVADQVIMLDHGRIVENGPAEEVLLHPQTEESQRFIRFWRLDQDAEINHKG